MGRRRQWDVRPLLELIECRVLLSSIIDIEASTPAVGHHGATKSTTLAAALSASGSGFSTTNNPANLTQGAQPASVGGVPVTSATNVALTPTGTLKPGEIKRERFVGRYVGPYSIVPGRTSTQASQILIQGAGSSNTMLHSDFQARIVVPTDTAANATTPISGVSTIFDRNLDTNTALGFDLAAPQSSVDHAGRPDDFTSVSIDANESAGTYVESYSQGVITIKYEPNGKHSKGVISQGTAIVTIHAQIYAPNASLIIRNASLDP